MTKTVVAEGYGGPEVLAVQDIVLPHPGEDQDIDVRAGTNPVDYKLYSGYMGRDPDDPPMPLGMEVSGIVAAVAPGINGYTGLLNVGDEVIATNVRGGYSERVIADVADVGHKPTPLSFEQAAGLLLAGGTAWHLLTVTRVAEGDTVLIHGAGGGVGLFAVQLAVARGAKVIGTASPTRHEQPGLRCDAGRLRRRAGRRVRAIGPVDAALDLVGTDEALDTSVEVVSDRGRIATIAGFARAAERWDRGADG